MVSSPVTVIVHVSLPIRPVAVAVGFCSLPLYVSAVSVHDIPISFSVMVTVALPVTGAYPSLVT